MNDEPVRVSSARCPGCGGTGMVAKPRLRLHFSSGQAATDTEYGPCRHCRDNEPGWRNAFHPPL